MSAIGGFDHGGAPDFRKTAYPAPATWGRSGARAYFPTALVSSKVRRFVKPPREDCSRRSRRDGGTLREMKARGAVRVLLGLCIVAIVGGAAWFYAPRSSGKTDAGKIDVGALQALGHVQSELHPLDACSLDFNSRDIGVGQHHETVFVTPCTPADLGSAIPFEVGTTWKRAHPSVKFIASRSKATDPWRIEVDTSRVTFQELQAALEELAPSLVAAYPKLLATYRAEYGNAADNLRRAAADREAARERAKSSYPAK